jgi:signal peptidase II
METGKIKDNLIAHSTLALVTSIIFVLDIFTKFIIEKNFQDHETMDIIGSFVQLILIYNKGGVFGIGQGKTVFFLIVSFFVLIFIFYTYFSTSPRSTAFKISMGLVLGGAFGNMYERLMSKKGVVDFVYVGWDKFTELFGQKIFLRWPAFNLADAAILIGAIMLAVILWKMDKTQKGDKDSGKEIG